MTILGRKQSLKSLSFYILLIEISVSHKDVDCPSVWTELVDESG